MCQTVVVPDTHQKKQVLTNKRGIIFNLFLSVFILGFIPAVQVFPQLVFLGGGLLPVRAISENRVSLHLLGAAGEL